MLNNRCQLGQGLWDIPSVKSSILYMYERGQHRLSGFIITLTQILRASFSVSPATVSSTASHTVMMMFAMARSSKLLINGALYGWKRAWGTAWASARGLIKSAGEPVRWDAMRRFALIPTLSLSTVPTCGPHPHPD